MKDLVPRNYNPNSIFMLESSSPQGIVSSILKNLVHIIAEPINEREKMKKQAEIIKEMIACSQKEKEAILNTLVHLADSGQLTPELAQLLLFLYRELSSYPFT